ncbi:ABC transporter substrate-binding protein [Schaalia sp. ZJ1691]|uniref:ABC transporter substrate-binding protein n=1 Tax=Schaalia sp. ZJ1691 TaxID=2709404 RepID=UPI0013EDB567|nr:ABC transporter substrate-binding protein [Schaalia sp. ZJ1691]
MISRSARIVLTALGVTSAIALSACASADPLAEEGDASSSSMTNQPIVVGSQDYYSNEIIAEIYAQALENAGFTVDRQMRIGQREVYLPEIEAGRVDLFPEYTGPLLKYWNDAATATLSDDVYDALVNTAPEGLYVLDQAPATDQDSYVVTQKFAKQWNLTSIADLAQVTTPLVMGANSEAENRPNGPKGLKKTYGVTASFTPIEDSGGPLTVKALTDDEIQLAIIYSSDPSISANKLVTLEDTKGLFLASHVVPLASMKISSEAAAVINSVSAKLTSEELLALNSRSISEQLPAGTIAKDWLAAQGM